MSSTLKKIAPVPILLLALLPLAHPPAYFLSFLFKVFLYVILAASWNLIGGFTGYLSFGHVAFFGIGVYVSAVLFQQFGISPFIGAIPAGLFASLVAWGIGLSLPSAAWTLFRGHHALLCLHRGSRGQELAVPGGVRRDSPDSSCRWTSTGPGPSFTSSFSDSPPFRSICSGGSSSRSLAWGSHPSARMKTWPRPSASRPQDSRSEHSRSARFCPGWRGGSTPITCPTSTRISSSTSGSPSSLSSWPSSGAGDPGRALSSARYRLPFLNELLSLFIRPEFARIIYGAMFMAVIIFMPDGVVPFLRKQGKRRLQGQPQDAGGG